MNTPQDIRDQGLQGVGASADADRAFVPSASSPSAGSRPKASIPCEGELQALATDLLCVIHRDGGQYIETHGFDVALKDAMLLSSHRIAENEELRHCLERTNRGGEASTYEIGNRLFVDLRAFLSAAGIDPSLCKLTITLQTKAAQKLLVQRLQRDAPPIGEFGRVSAAQAGNEGGRWQGVEYEFAAQGTTR